MLSILFIDDNLDHAHTLAYDLDLFMKDMPFPYKIECHYSLTFNPDEHLDVNIIFLNYHIIPEYAGKLEIAYGNHGVSPVFYIYDYYYRYRKDIHVNRLMAYLTVGQFINDLNHSFPYSIDAIYKNQYLTYHRTHKPKFIAYDDILYVTKDHDTSVITSIKGIHTANDHFELLGRSLPNDNFFFSTSNRVVNIHHILSVQNYKLYLDNGEQLTLDTKGKNYYEHIIKESPDDGDSY